jgi:hypothetical protein
MDSFGHSTDQRATFRSYISGGYLYTVWPNNEIEEVGQAEATPDHQLSAIDRDTQGRSRRGP